MAHKLNGHKVEKNLERLMKLKRLLFSPSHFFQVSEYFFFITDHTAAILLSYLLGRELAVRAAERYNGWFYCKQKTITKKINMSAKAQTRAVSKLKEQGFLKWEMRGLPAKRYFLIDHDAIMDAVSDLL